MNSQYFDPGDPHRSIAADVRPREEPDEEEDEDEEDDNGDEGDDDEGYSE